MKYIYDWQGKITLTDLILADVEKAKKNIGSAIKSFNNFSEVKNYSIDVVLDIPEEYRTGEMKYYIKVKGYSDNKTIARLGYELPTHSMPAGPEDISDCPDFYFDMQFVHNLVTPFENLHYSFSIVEKQHIKSLCELLKENLKSIKDELENKGYPPEFEKEIKQYILTMNKSLNRTNRKEYAFSELEIIRLKGIEGYWLDNHPEKTKEDFKDLAIKTSLSSYY